MFSQEAQKRLEEFRAEKERRKARRIKDENDLREWLRDKEKRQELKDRTRVGQLIESIGISKEYNFELAFKLLRNVKIEKKRGCWFLSNDWSYYYEIKIDGERYLAHRLSYELFVGPLNDLLCCHRCDRPGCINPEHLYQGTHSNNTEDMWLKKKLKKLRKYIRARELADEKSNAYWNRIRR